MESMNKFKVLTIIFICLFVFAVGAIYSNTKDVSAAKSQSQSKTEISENNIQTESTVQVTDNQDLSSQVDLLNRRVDELSEKINNNNENNANSTGLNCRIYGSLTANGVEQLTPEVAIQEAKVNNNDLVVTCSFKM